VDVGDDAIQHAQPNGNALAGDLVNHLLHRLGSHFMSPQFDCICNYRLVKGEPAIFPEGIRIRARPRRESVTDSYREPAVQWLSDLPLKLAIGFEPPIMQRRKRLRQLIWNIGP